MKQKLWITLVTYLAYCIDKELYKAIDYLCEQVRVLVEQQVKQNKRILLTNSQRMRISCLTVDHIRDANGPSVYSAKPLCSRLPDSNVFIQPCKAIRNSNHHSRTKFSILTCERIKC